jgi:hypothetical protein
MTETPTVTEDLTAQAAAEAQAAMAEMMADNTKLLTNYLSLQAKRIMAEKELEELAKEQWAAWRALTSSRNGGFSEAQLKRQAITAPAPVPRRDRGKKKTSTRKPASAAATPVVEQQDGQQFGSGDNSGQYGG